MEMKKTMCNFNKQTEQTKEFMSLFMQKAADSVGGANFLLALIEAMKTKRPNALIVKEKQVASNNTIIKWNKVVFKDKLEVIEGILLEHKSTENPDFNILENENAKKRKNILNMIKTMSPIEFVVTPQNHKDGEGFSFKVFDIAEDKSAKMNPIFIAMFFCGTEYTKKALKYRL